MAKKLGENECNDCGNITDLCTQLSTIYSGKSLDLGKCTFTRPPQCTPSASSWVKVPLWLGRTGTLLCFAVQPDFFAITAKPFTSHKVCVVSQGPKSLSRGTLDLGPQAAIVFDGTCSKICLSDTVIKGASSNCRYQSFLFPKASRTSVSLNPCTYNGAFGRMFMPGLSSHRSYSYAI
jgi:hypothetical protein